MANQRFSITPATAATDNRLTDSIHRTLTVIGIFGNREGWCWPGQGTLAKMRGVSRQTISSHIKALTELGYLNIHPRYDEETGAQKSNMMQIKFDFEPDLTGGVKSKALQGGTSPRLYTPLQAQGFTHNALSNTTMNGIDAHNKIATDSVILPLIDALKPVSKEVYTESRHNRFDEAALTLFGWDATIEQISGFGQWWKVNGWHDDKPALKNILDSWLDYKNGSKTEISYR